MNEIVEILMKRDGLSKKEAVNEVREAKRMIENAILS